MDRYGDGDVFGFEDDVSPPSPRRGSRKFVLGIFCHCCFFATKALKHKVIIFCHKGAKARSFFAHFTKEMRFFYHTEENEFFIFLK
jgi:hypothetical protein